MRRPAWVMGHSLQGIKIKLSQILISKIRIKFLLKNLPGTDEAASLGYGPFTGNLIKL